MPIKIMSCACSHKFQDRVYGRGRRVFNVGADAKRFTCTVCGKSVATQESPKKKEKEG